MVVGEGCERQRRAAWSDFGSKSWAKGEEDIVELGYLNETEADLDLESDLLRESLRVDDSKPEFTEVLPVEEDFEERAPLMVLVTP